MGVDRNEPGFDPGPAPEQEEECSWCGELKTLGFGRWEDECAECDHSHALFLADERATRRAEGGYGYSGGWTGH